MQVGRAAHIESKADRQAADRQAHEQGARWGGGSRGRVGVEGGREVPSKDREATATNAPTGRQYL